MGKIIILDEGTSNKIAAGEVVERPASVVKELVENSVDAGAESVIVEIRNGGITYIKVTDNGSGIEADDVEIAFERHSTSKIRSAADLESISTFGFRGEALASIAAVSVVQLTTRTKNSPYGSYIELHGGKVMEKRQAGCPVGTTVVVKDLFYNTPARYKFLKKDSTEAGYVSDIVERIALGNPHISFKLISNGSTVLHTPGNNDLLSVIFSIYGRETAKGVCEIKYEDSGIRISGYAGKPEIARANRNHQSIFLNNRYIKSKIITSALDEAYKTLLMKNKYAFIVIKLEMNPLLFDVNVHPGKMEVRFSNEQDVFRHVYHAVSNALLGKQNPVVGSVISSQNTVAGSTLINMQNIATGANTEVPAALKYSRSGPVDRPYIQQKIDLEDNWGKRMPVCQQSEVSGGSLKEKSSVDESILREDDAIPGYAEEHPSENERVSSPADMRIIGQAFSTYIILQHEDKLILMDQHAAHERILYEELKRKYKEGRPLAQMLVTPVVVELTYRELKFLEDRKEFFGKLGFIYENFGNNSIVLRSVPFELAGGEHEVKAAFLEIVDAAMTSGGAEFKLKDDETIYAVACKAAVKANKRLDEMEIKALLNRLAELENPFTCPHGRPVIVEISKHDLEKMFKRIV